MHLRFEANFHRSATLPPAIQTTDAVTYLNLGSWSSVGLTWEQPAQRGTPGGTSAEGPQQEKNQSAQSGPEAAPGKIEQKGEGLPTRAPTPAVVALALTPGLMRDSGEIKRLIIPPDADLVQLQLVLSEDSYKNYRAVIMTAERVPVWRSNKLNAKLTNHVKSIVLRLAAARFAQDDYLVKLSGVNSEGEAEDVHTYYFRVLKQ